MGDRANIVLVGTSYGGKEHSPIYLYTHWSGLEWPEMLRKALTVARPRWNDEAYCNRILIGELYSDLFSEKSETGGGVSTYGIGQEYDNIEVHYNGRSGTVGTKDGHTLYTFEEYVSLSSVRWSDLNIKFQYMDEYYGEESK